MQIQRFLWSLLKTGILFAADPKERKVVVKKAASLLSTSILPDQLNVLCNMLRQDSSLSNRITLLTYLSWKDCKWCPLTPSELHGKQQ